MNRTHTIEGIFSLAEEKGMKPRIWSWKKLQSYNGYTHEQRVLKWQALHLAIRLGLIPAAETFPCSICGTRESTVTYHSERYDILTEQYPVCGPHHALIHTRSWKPKAWRDLLSTYGDGTRWFESLRLTPSISRTD